MQPRAPGGLVQTALGSFVNKYPMGAKGPRDSLGPCTLVWEFTFLPLIITWTSMHIHTCTHTYKTCPRSKFL